MKKVCVCTPTKNRGWTETFSRDCFAKQLYPAELLTWIILDNSDTPEQGWKNPTERITKPQTIGQMRQRCLELALQSDCEYIVFWDDDDYYPPTRISAGVAALEANPTADISTASEMWMLLVRENILLNIASHGPNHGTAATFTIRRTYAETHSFHAENVKGEEAFFTKNWTAKMVQIPTEQMIVVMGHGKNTVDKSQIRDNPGLFRATTENDTNGLMCFRSRWPVEWGIWKSTFSGVISEGLRVNNRRGGLR